MNDSKVINKLENLKKLREIKHITQVKLATDLGISQELISRYEVGSSFPQPNMLIKLADYFNCSVDYALGFTNIKNYKGNRSKININLSSKRLKDLRKQKKYTQEYIAKELDINRSLISKYEKGHTIISTTFLIEYVKLFKVSSDYLLGKIDKIITIEEKAKEKEY